MANKNICLNNGFYATAVGENYVTWGCQVKEERGNVFTKKLALELLEIMEKLYKQRFPDRPEPKFYKIEYDMTNYERSLDVNLDGEYYSVPAGDRKKGTYNTKTDTLRIYKNAYPVYENKQGHICRDTIAIIESDF